MLKHRPIAVPADPGTRVIADDQGLDEVPRFQAGKPRRPGASRQQPVGKRVGRAEVGGVEIVAPAIGRGQPLAKPAVKAERRKLGRVDRADQRAFLIRRDDLIDLGQTGKVRFITSPKERREP